MAVIQMGEQELSRLRVMTDLVDGRFTVETSEGGITTSFW